MRVKDLEEAVVYFPRGVNLCISVDVRSADPSKTRRVFVDEIVDTQYHPHYGVILSMAGDWDEKGVMQVEDFKRLLANYPDDINIHISVDVRSVDPLEARRVFVDEIVDAKYDPEYGITLSMAGDWNDGK